MSIGSRLDRLPLLSWHRQVVLVVGVGLFFDFFDSNLSGTIARVLEAEFGMSANQLKLVLASAFLGQFLGSIFLGGLADRIGRRRAFMLNLAGYSLFTFLGAFSPSAAWLIVMRFFAGVGIGAENVVSDCYLAEILPARFRGRMIAAAYTIGFLGVPAVGFTALWLAPREIAGVDGWRILFILGGLGSAVVWLLRRRLIESPRWLAVQGRHDEADSLVSELEREAEQVAPLPAPAAPVGAQEPNAAEVGRQLSFGSTLRLLMSRQYRRRTLSLWLFCALSVTAYYGFGTLAPQVLASKGIDLVNSLAYVAASFIGYPLGSLLSMPLLDRLERKTLLAGSAVVMSAFGVLFGIAESGVVIVVAGIGYTLVSNIFANASHVFLGELYPTQMRTGAAGIAYSFSRLSAACIPFVLLPLLAAQGAGVLFLVIGGCILVLAVVVMSMGERTTGRGVEEFVSHG